MSDAEGPGEESGDRGSQPPAEPSYTVGYRRPPVEHQFKSGRSGNPRGRRKPLETIGAIFEEELGKRIPVTDERGRRSWITLDRVLIRALVRRAAKSDRALKLVVELRGRYRDSDARQLDPGTLSVEDAALLDEIIEDRARERAKGSPGGGGPP